MPRLAIGVTSLLVCLPEGVKTKEVKCIGDCGGDIVVRGRVLPEPAGALALASPFLLFLAALLLSVCLRSLRGSALACSFCAF